MKSFTIRAYTKKELALLYFPNSSTPHVAVNHLISWIKRCRPLMQELEESGYHKVSKFFTSREVRMILSYLGEP